VAIGLARMNLTTAPAGASCVETFEPVCDWQNWKARIRVYTISEASAAATWETDKRPI
jgi:hypothetical protein